MDCIKISAVIITFNEEKNINNCIVSLKEVVDEIVVVDSFSTDGTEEICRQNDVKFVQHAFDGYVQQKNRALDLASNNHVLSLDADEVLSPELQQSVQAIKKNWDADAYNLNRLNNFCGHWIRHCGWYPDSKVRLWDKRKGRWSGFSLHEIVVMEKNAVVKRAKGDILHYSYDSISEHILRINKYSGIMAQGSFDLGKKPNVFKLIFSPIFYFIKNYFFRLGFLDGIFGFFICVNMAHYCFLKYAKRIEIYKTQKQCNNNQ